MAMDEGLRARVRAWGGGGGGGGGAPAIRTRAPGRSSKRFSRRATRPSFETGSREISSSALPGYGGSLARGRGA
jgi:hypothetical protein